GGPMALVDISVLRHGSGLYRRRDRVAGDRPDATNRGPAYVARSFSSAAIDGSAILPSNHRNVAGQQAQTSVRAGRLDAKPDRAQGVTNLLDAVDADAVGLTRPAVLAGNLSECREAAR